VSLRCTFFRRRGVLRVDLLLQKMLNSDALKRGLTICNRYETTLRFRKKHQHRIYCLKMYVQNLFVNVMLRNISCICHVEVRICRFVQYQLHLSR